eukprot:CAMPEP_0168451088 /NCGR_PEP_ID=MMETSP0228-20121227/48458_1 /TAXON_ID=133427 /ORGANISM="Protoceratium reticulatum, Strain CCCM 535 (=CCMP 1889)" /LENGTH=176 /DNA_ID=CAMNT_0008465699 /DNA_START=174 /DNA_END=701 /DNA_ORIENTATION=+
MSAMATVTTPVGKWSACGERSSSSPAEGQNAALGKGRRARASRLCAVDHDDDNGHRPEHGRKGDSQRSCAHLPSGLLARKPSAPRAAAQEGEAARGWGRQCDLEGRRLVEGPQEPGPLLYALRELPIDLVVGERHEGLHRECPKGLGHGHCAHRAGPAAGEGEHVRPSAALRVQVD